MDNDDLIIGELTDLLREAVDVIEGLADQYGISDTWYEPSFKKIEDKLKELDNG